MTDSKTLMSILNAGAQDVAARLMLANASEVSPAAGIAEKFGILKVTLDDWKAKGRVIVFRPEGTDEDIFPIAQFEEGDVAPWAKQIVSALGNGLAAFHFLLVPRESLDGANLSRVILGGDEKAANKIAKYLAQIVAE